MAAMMEKMTDADAAGADVSPEIPARSLPAAASAAKRRKPRTLKSVDTRAVEDRTPLLEATFDTVDQGVLLVDASGIVQFFNSRALILLDLPASLMEAKPTYADVRQYQLDRDDYRRSSPDVRAWVANGAKEARPYTFERERPNGVILEIRTVPLPDGSMVCTYNDVTDHRRNEVARLESEARLRALNDALPQMVWVARAGDGTLSYANQRYYDYLGAIGPNLADRMAVQHPDDRPRVARLWTAAVAAGRVLDVEARWRRRDGCYRWHRLTLVPVWNGGEIVEWLGTALDIDDLVSARDTLRENSGLLERALEAAGAGLFEWFADGDKTRLSGASQRILGLDRGGEHTVGLADTFAHGDFTDAVHPDDLATVAAELERAAATGSTYRAEYRVPLPGLPDRWVLGIGRFITDDAGRPHRMVGINLDITDRKTTEERLRLSEERLSLALDASNDGIWDWDVPTGEAWYSDRWYTMLGYEPGDFRAHADTWEYLIHPDDRGRALALTAAHFDGTTPAYECEHRLRHRDGSWSWVLARGKVMARDGDGRPLRCVGTHIDINARKAAESQIAYMARHDALTDLPNRTLFHDRLHQRLAEMARYGGTCAVLSLDLDRFKTVNDTMGHFAGDAVLREVARRLKGALDTEDTVARLGGDEFAVLIADAEGRDVAAIADRLIGVTSLPLPFGQHLFEVGLSVGIALAPQQGADAETLFKRADLALYRAKAEGRNQACLFAAAMDEEATARRELERDLRLAIAQDQLTVYYQPQMRGITGELVGFEALVRWHHPERGLVMPSTFIPLAEESGLVVSLGEWVLRSACREAASWSKPLKIAVNLSPRQFQQADLPEVVLAILTETGLSPTRLELEVTEAVIINDMVRALTILRRLKGLGISVAMDDFGTGYSSLATLQSFPFDKIKIDRMFVGQLMESAQAKAIVRAVLGLGRSLNMGVVAEGVETTEQLLFLAQEDCDEVQGYLLGKPQPIANFAEAVGGRGVPDPRDLRSRLYPEDDGGAAQGETSPPRAHAS